MSRLRTHNRRKLRKVTHRGLPWWKIIGRRSGDADGLPYGRAWYLATIHLKRRPALLIVDAQFVLGDEVPKATPRRTGSALSDIAH